MKILILHGPNLNMLGRREPEIYGTLTLDELNRAIAQAAEERYSQREGASAIELQFFQTNHEGQLIDLIQSSARRYDGIVYNPAAHTHYSIALRDAVLSVTTPVVEVHLTDIKSREPYRQLSLFSDICLACFMGEGPQSYVKGLAALVDYLDLLTTSEDNQ
jgi:3-dehydroquinate dehydratase-2